MPAFRTLAALAAAIGLAAASACSGTPPAASPTAPQGVQAPVSLPPPGSAEAQMQQLVGDAACSADNQCRTVGWGAKACGGPERWIAWSTQRTDGAALQALADRHAAARRGEQQRKGMVSTCSIVPDPGARCIAQHCQLGNAVEPVAE